MQFFDRRSNDTRGFLVRTLLLLCLVSPATGIAAETGFPFDRELILDADPMRGSKRVPNLEIAPNGAMIIYLWCANGEGHVTVADTTVTFVPTSLRDNQCSPAQRRSDEDLLLALTQATTWRRSGNIVTFDGTTTLRFRLATN